MLEYVEVIQTSGSTYLVEDDLKKNKIQTNSTAAGKTFTLQGSSGRIYVPLWCLGEIKGTKLLPGTHSPHSTRCYKQAALLTTLIEQEVDDMLLKIINTMQTVDSGKRFQRFRCNRLQ